MKKALPFALAALSALILAGCQSAPASGPAPEPSSQAAAPKPQETVKEAAFAASFAEAEKQAKAENKLVLVKFTADWCAPCKLMKKEAFSDSEMIAVLDPAVVSVEVDIDKAENKEIVKKYLGEDSAIPAVVMVKADGTPVGEVHRGYDAGKVAEFRTWVSGQIEKGKA